LREAEFQAPLPDCSADCHKFDHTDPYTVQNY